MRIRNTALLTDTSPKKQKNTGNIFVLWLILSLKKHREYENKKYLPELVLKLNDVGGGCNPDIKGQLELVRHHVGLHPALHNRQVDGGHVAQREAGVRFQPLLLLRTQAQQLVDHVLRLEESVTQHEK